jgi:undecaprenyl-diphosphatase
MFAIALAAALAPATRREGGVLFFLGLLGSIGRVFCGLHFPLDIAGSLGVALLAVAVVARLRNPLRRINAQILETYTVVIGNLLPARPGTRKGR